MFTKPQFTSYFKRKSDSSSHSMKKHRATVFERKVIWKMSGHQEDEVTVKCKKLHTEALHNLNVSHKITVIKSRT